MPDWLIEILRQFPIVVVIGLAIWYAEKRVREKEIRLEARTDQYRKELEQREKRMRKDRRDEHDAEIRRLQENQKIIVEKDEQLLATKDEQIANLTKQVAALTKKIQG